MKYLPILHELFESDTIIFLIIGIAAVVAGLRVLVLLSIGTVAIGGCIGFTICPLMRAVHR